MKKLTGPLPQNVIDALAQAQADTETAAASTQAAMTAVYDYIGEPPPVQAAAGRAVPWATLLALLQALLKALSGGGA